MKIHLLTLIFLTASLSTVAQHVGIGVDTPAAVLHVIDTSTTAPTLKIESANQVDLDFHSLAFKGKSIRFFEDGAYRSSIFASGSNLSLFTDYLTTIPNAALKITHTNNVGINFGPFATPSQALHVNGKIKIGDDLKSPSPGTMRYNASSKLVQFYNGGSWLNASTPWLSAGSSVHYDDGAVLVGRSTTIGAERFGVRYNTSGTGYGGMYMETNGGPNTRPFYGYAIDAGIKMWHYYDGGDQAWKINNAGVKFSLRSDGKTGIGVEVPQSRLDVLGGIWNVDVTEGDLRIGSTSYRLAVGVATAGAGAGITRIYAKGGQAKLVLGSDDTDVLTVDSDDQVGIGINSPLSDLHIYDESGLADFRLESNNGNAIMRLDASAGNTGYSQIRFTEAGALSGAIWYNYTNNSIEVFEGGLALSMRDARVGIGTTPSGNHKLSVAGSIISEEIKVELYENWPDYVFDDHYDMMSIDELSAFIKRNGHLPGVPSAREVQANKGIELGEMNRILLEKIEELTLLLIEQQTEIEALKEKIK